MLKAVAGVNMIHVPYRSGGQSSNGVLTGEISILFATAPTSLQHIEKGRLSRLPRAVKVGCGSCRTLNDSRPRCRVSMWSSGKV